MNAEIEGKTSFQIEGRESWAACESRDFVPTENQLLVISAVQAALNAGLFYSDEIRLHCAKALALAPETLAANFKMRVEGGIFGMDCYYARKFLEAKSYRAREELLRQRLKPHVGMKLGALMFSDLKRVTGMTVMQVGERITVHGKRGSVSVGLEADAVGIKNAMDRAAEKGLRKNDFDAFVDPPLCVPAAVPACDSEPSLF